MAQITHGSAAYEAAYLTCNAAINAYNAAQKAYRTMQIGDDEFIAARNIYSAAMAAFDVAYDTEAANNQTGGDCRL